MSLDGWVAVDLRSLCPAGDAPRLWDGQRRVQVQPPGGALLQPKPGNRIWGETVVELTSITDQTVVSRKTAIYGGLAALTALVLPGQVRAQAKTQPGDSFVVLLKGLYQPVTHGPDLGLSTVDLNDGSYSTTRIYPVHGTPGSKNPHKPIGRFYVQLDGDLCAYHIPGGSFSMRFTDSNTVFVDDGQGGRFLEGTFELTILEGTGIYKPFAGGHNHMVDKLHFLAPGDGSGGIDEYCFCFISRQ